jgi:hypothetical protein
LPSSANDQPDAHGHHGDERTGRRQADVVADRRAHDAEAEHRDEVHRPDAGAADRDGREAEPPDAPAGAGAERSPYRTDEAEHRPENRQYVADGGSNPSMVKVMDLRIPVTFPGRCAECILPLSRAVGGGMLNQSPEIGTMGRQ